jgi:hypothetical protein
MWGSSNSWLSPKPLLGSTLRSPGWSKPSSEVVTRRSLKTVAEERNVSTRPNPHLVDSNERCQKSTLHSVLGVPRSLRIPSSVHGGQCLWATLRIRGWTAPLRPRKSNSTRRVHQHRTAVLSVFEFLRASKRDVSVRDKAVYMASKHRARSSVGALILSKTSHPLCQLIRAVLTEATTFAIYQHSHYRSGGVSECKNQVR